MPNAKCQVSLGNIMQSEQLCKVRNCAECKIVQNARLCKDQNCAKTKTVQSDQFFRVQHCAMRKMLNSNRHKTHILIDKSSILALIQTPKSSSMHFIDQYALSTILKRKRYKNIYKYKYKSSKYNYNVDQYIHK